MKKKEYLDIMEEQIRCKQARAEVRQELEGHIEDQTETYLSQGMTAEEAEKAAVMDMGDPVETGNEMDRIHRPRMPWKSIGMIIGVSLAVFALQYILRISEPSLDSENGQWITGGNVFYLGVNVVGWLVMLGICYLDYTRIGKYALQLMAAGCIGLVLVGAFGGPVNGYFYFIDVPFIGVISANVLTFLFVPLYGALLYRYRGQGYAAIVKGILWMLPSVLLTMPRAGLIPAFIIGTSYMIILTVAICKNWFEISKKITIGILWAVYLSMPVLGGVYIMNQGASYQKMRLQVLLDPYGTEMAYQTLMLRKLLAGSKMIGTKAGFAEDMYQIVESRDYALSIICAYYGMLIAAILAVGIVLLFCRFFQKSLGQKNQMGMIMGTGVSVVFLVELFLYILVNTGQLPGVGVSYCPFLGYGGSGIMITYILLGILLSIYRYENVAPQVRIKKRIRIQVIRS